MPNPYMMGDLNQCSDWLQIAQLNFESQQEEEFFRSIQGGFGTCFGSYLTGTQGKLPSMKVTCILCRN
jgi:hypothetical protein